MEFVSYSFGLFTLNSNEGIGQLIEPGVTERVYKHDALFECNKKLVVYNEYDGGKYPT